MIGLVGTIFKGVIGIGKTLIKGKEAVSGNAENELARQSESFNNARGFKPEGWLGKQIRPVITAVVVSPLLLITIIICILMYKILIPVINSSTDINTAIAQIKTMFTLYDGLSDRYWDLTQIVIIFWFGGRMQKYVQNHIETKHVIRASAQANGTSQDTGDSDIAGEIAGDKVSKLGRMNDIMDEEQKRSK